MSYSISDVSEEFKLTFRTIRFWEDRGLINPKRDKRERVYSDGDRAVISEIVSRRSQHFTVEEIKQALDAGGFTKQQLLDQTEFLREERVEIDRALVALEDEIAAADSHDEPRQEQLKTRAR